MSGDSNNKQKLLIHENLHNCFSISELKKINTRLKLKYHSCADLTHLVKQDDIVEELFNHCDTHGMVKELKEECESSHPKLDWGNNQEYNTCIGQPIIIDNRNNERKHDGTVAENIMITKPVGNAHNVNQLIKDTTKSPTIGTLNNIKDNIFEIRCYNNDDELQNCGTGFFISGNLILTCHHCIFDQKNDQYYHKIRVINYEKGFNQTTARINAFCSKEHDYALLYTDISYSSYFQIGNENDLNSIDLETEIYCYGFGAMGQNDKRNKTYITASFHSKEEYPEKGISNALTFKVNDDTPIYNGQSGSPLCLIQDNSTPLVIGTLQGEFPLCKSNCETEWKKMYGLPITEVFSKLDALKTLKENLKFNDVQIYSLGDQPDTVFKINTKPVTIQELNAMFNNFDLEGLNFFEARAFAHILGGRLPTEGEWSSAADRNAIFIYKNTKEWLQPDKSESGIYYIMDTDHKVPLEQFPEVISSNIVLRIIKE